MLQRVKSKRRLRHIVDLVTLPRLLILESGMLKKILLGLKNVNRCYVSSADQQITEFNHTHAKSASQQAEINRCESVRFLRDHPEKIKIPSTKLPKDF